MKKGKLWNLILNLLNVNTNIYIIITCSHIYPELVIVTFIGIRSHHILILRLISYITLSYAFKENGCRYATVGKVRCEGVRVCRKIVGEE